MVLPTDAPFSKLLTIKPEKKLPMPVLSAALGMALSFYLFPFLRSGVWVQTLFLGLFFLLLVLINFLRVINLPFLWAPSNGGIPPAISKTTIHATAVFVGLVLGFISSRAVPPPPQMGLPLENVSSVSGILREDPRSLQSGSGMGILELKACGIQEGIRAAASGRLTVFFPGESIPRLKEFGRGCEIFLDGALYNGDSTRGNSERALVFRASSVHIINGAPALESFRTNLRMTLLEKFQGREKSPVWGSLASALLLGIRDDLETDLTEAFRNSGCAHILALSGMHLAIISGVLAFLIRRPLGIRWASLVGAIFILLYVFVAGSQASLVRSAIMYLIGALSVWGMMKGKPLSLLSMAFIIQIVFQGETGISLSFILSYLALAGILTMGGTLQSLFRGRLPNVLSPSLCASLGAFIFTAPVVVFYFGYLKPIGILTGIIIAPLSAVFMVFAMAALGASFLPFPLFAVLDFILTGVYNLIKFIVTLAGKVPGFTLSNPLPVLIFSILAWIGILFIQKRDYKNRSSIASFN